MAGFGFPSRFFRSILGPNFRNALAVESPELDGDADAFNLAFWQMVGANLVVPRAVVIAKWNAGSSSFDYRYQAEAWNAQGTQTHPVLTRTGGGAYKYTFAANYKNEKDEDIDTELLAAEVTVASTGSHFAHWNIDPSTPLVVDVAITSGADRLFMLKVF